MAVYTQCILCAAAFGSHEQLRDSYRRAAEQLQNTATHFKGLHQGGKRPGGETGSMCDAEKDWHERSFRASGAIDGCQKSPLDKPEMTFSFFIFKLPVTSF